MVRLLIDGAPLLVVMACDLSQPDEILETICKGCDSRKNCTYEEPNKVPTCSEALENSMSPGGYSTTIHDLVIERGYWRATTSSKNVLACYNVEACKGGLTDSPDYCHEGYEGPCKRFYASYTNQMCTFP